MRDCVPGHGRGLSRPSFDAARTPVQVPSLAARHDAAPAARLRGSARPRLPRRPRGTRRVEPAQNARRPALGTRPLRRAPVREPTTHRGRGPRAGPAALHLRRGRIPVHGRRAGGLADAGTATQAHRRGRQTRSLRGTSQGTREHVGGRLRDDAAAAGFRPDHAAQYAVHGGSRDPPRRHAHRRGACRRFRTAGGDIHRDRLPALSASSLRRQHVRAAHGRWPRAPPASPARRLVRRPAHRRCAVPFRVDLTDTAVPHDRRLRNCAC